MGFSVVPQQTTDLFAQRLNASLSNGLANPADQESFWGPEGLSFESLLDAVNPLQQLPVVSTIYRSLTNDPISAASRLAGGALFGGPLGLASAVLNEVVEAETGNDIGGNIMALLGDTGSSIRLGDGFSEIANVAQARSAYQAYTRAVQQV